jgi:hypothetical protein
LAARAPTFWRFPSGLFRAFAGLAASVNEVSAHVSVAHSFPYAFQ